jgi:hypothetical protein
VKTSKNFLLSIPLQKWNYPNDFLFNLKDSRKKHPAYAKKKAITKVTAKVRNGLGKEGVVGKRIGAMI